MMEADFVCPTPGSPCMSTIACGDGVVGTTETCDDRNHAADDGCSATCQTEAGWTCTTPGLPCTATACGDGVMAGTEECEDGDMPPAGGDGCDAHCHFEDGYACDMAGMACTHVTCGNHVREGTEQCDDGNNDLGDGCDPFCHHEPQCTDGTCVSVCGDGVLLGGELCDDGNLRDGDGCDHTCLPEMGFTCAPSGAVDPDSVSIPIVYRDFRGNDLTGGHPDFEHYGDDDRGICTMMLDADHKPAYAHAGGSSHTTTGESFYRMWYRDTDTYTQTVISRLPLPRTGPGAYAYDNGGVLPAR